MQNTNYYTKPEVKKYLGVPGEKVKALVESGKLTGWKNPDGSGWCISKSSVNKYLRKRNRKTSIAVEETVNKPNPAATAAGVEKKSGKKSKKQLLMQMLEQVAELKNEIRTAREENNMLRRKIHDLSTKLEDRELDTVAVEQTMKEIEKEMARQDDWSYLDEYRAILNTFNSFADNEYNRIAIIEDDQDIVATWRPALEKQGWKIYHYNDTAQAVRDIYLNFFAAIVLDLNFELTSYEKNMTGDRFYQILLDFGKKKIPALIVSGEPPETVKEKARQFGCDYLLKPVTPEALSKKLQEIVCM